MASVKSVDIVEDKDISGTVRDPADGHQTPHACEAVITSVSGESVNFSNTEDLSTVISLDSVVDCEEESMTSCHHGDTGSVCGIEVGVGSPNTSDSGLLTNTGDEEICQNKASLKGVTQNEIYSVKPTANLLNTLSDGEICKRPSDHDLCDGFLDNTTTLVESASLEGHDLGKCSC